MILYYIVLPRWTGAVAQARRGSASKRLSAAADAVDEDHFRSVLPSLPKHNIMCILKTWQHFRPPGTLFLLYV